MTKQVTRKPQITQAFRRGMSWGRKGIFRDKLCIEQSEESIVEVVQNRIDFALEGNLTEELLRQDADIISPLACFLNLWYNKHNTEAQSSPAQSHLISRRNRHRVPPSHSFSQLLRKKLSHDHRPLVLPLSLMSPVTILSHLTCPQSQMSQTRLASVSVPNVPNLTYLKSQCPDVGLFRIFGAMGIILDTRLGEASLIKRTGVNGVSHVSSLRTEIEEEPMSQSSQPHIFSVPTLTYLKSQCPQSHMSSVPNVANVAKHACISIPHPQSRLSPMFPAPRRTCPQCPKSRLLVTLPASGACLLIHLSEDVPQSRSVKIRFLFWHSFARKVSKSQSLPLLL